MTYFTAFGWTIRLNPVYSKKMLPPGWSPWDFHIFQIVKRPSDKR